VDRIRALPLGDPRVNDLFVAVTSSFQIALNFQAQRAVVAGRLEVTARGAVVPSIFAENGEQAISLFEQWHPHFIWMDMRMPVLDGYQATARIRELPGGDEVKIVAITASAFKEQRPKILTAGCDDVVHKPFHAHEIFDAMAKQLGVCYRYEEAVEKAAGGTAEVNAEAIGALSMELRETLRRAARALNDKDFISALAPVRECDPALAEGLAVLAGEFRFDRILELLNPTGDS